MCVRKFSDLTREKCFFLLIIHVICFLASRILEQVGERLSSGSRENFLKYIDGDLMGNMKVQIDKKPRISIDDSTKNEIERLDRRDDERMKKYRKQQQRRWNYFNKSLDGEKRIRQNKRKRNGRRRKARRKKNNNLDGFYSSSLRTDKTSLYSGHLPNYNLTHEQKNNEPENSRIKEWIAVKNSTVSPITQVVQLTELRTFDPIPLEPTKRYQVVNLRDGSVEKEFSRHLEEEISKSRLEHPSYIDSGTGGKSSVDAGVSHSMENEIQILNDPRRVETRYQVPKPNGYENSQFDLQRVLGYTKTEEDLPILEMEKEVLKRAMEDYSAYMSRAYNAKKKIVDTLLSGGSKIDAVDGHSGAPVHHTAENGHKDIIDALIGGDMTDQAKNRAVKIPVIPTTPVKISYKSIRAEGKSEDVSLESTNHDGNLAEYSGENRDEGFLGIKDDPISNNSDKSVRGTREDVEGRPIEMTLLRKSEGDLSCMSGTFLPAPLVPYAMIRYVKSSVPEQEYLEANYECVSGYLMTTGESRLFCKNREWLGQVPKCEIRERLDELCAQSDCEHICSEINSQAQCLCREGFKLDGRKCIDINECEEDNGNCDFKCVNNEGSHRCECPEGMLQGQDKYSCEDIDECLSNEGHGPCQDTCHNEDGGYKCSCDGLPGTTLALDNHTCHEQPDTACSINNAGCSHTCLSTMGQVFCLCPNGFMLGNDWKTCQDVNECEMPDLQTEVCHYGCINTPGSYRCAEPLELKDRPIPMNSPNSCLPGYQLSDDSSCVDINECAENNGNCDEVCENTAGNFFCACEGDERILSPDGRTCTGITENARMLAQVDQSDKNSISCPPLNPAGDGYLMCSHLMTQESSREMKRIDNQPDTKCFLKCPSGYELRGEYELTCLPNGTWDGPKHGECVRYSTPRLDCPPDVTAELSPGQDEAFVMYEQPSTDLDWFRYVRSKPAWGTRLEANLRLGVHKVTFYARHPVSKKQATCILRITVTNGEAPKVENCPSDIEVMGRNGSAITWTEPIFTDNIKVTKVHSNQSPGSFFSYGGHKIEYEASDEAGWTTKCIFTVVLREA